MIEKKILYVDLDGVVADFEHAVKLIEPGMVWEEDNVDRICKANVRIFRDLPEIPDSIEVIKELKEYYEIYFLSTPMKDIPESYMDKRIWLRNIFGEWVDRRLVLTHRKDLCIGDYLIDDRLKNGSENFKGFHIHIFQSPFETWEKVKDYLIKVHNIRNEYSKEEKERS